MVPVGTYTTWSWPTTRTGFTEMRWAVEPRTDLSVSTTDSNLAVVPESVSLQELVDGLNALGISPRDLIAILQAVKASGALQAEIEVL